MSVENIKTLDEFEQKISVEIERKFIPIFPEQLEQFRDEARPIEQYYLSHPAEKFSLRFRETLSETGELQHEATLKDSGTTSADGINRIEVTAPVGAALYEYYRDESTPIIRKLRVEPRPGVAIDFFENGSIQLESENDAEWQQFINEFGDVFVDVSDDLSSRNEWKAHFSFRRQHEGREALAIAADLRTDDIVSDILRSRETPRVVHIGGRSGSGKSTIVREMREKLDEMGLSSAVLSTDDYHRGTKWLVNYNGGKPWTHWDDPIVYDTKAMAVDLANLVGGQPIYARGIDWTVAEPVITGVVSPVDVIIIEGIYAQSPDITRETDLSYEMTTSLATCIGRRLIRDMRERPEFANPTKSLEYMLREAEPAYRNQISRGGLAQTKFVVRPSASQRSS